MLIPWIVAAAASALAPSTSTPKAKRVDKPEYVVELLAPERAQRNKPATATVRLSARAGFHVNGDYPMSFRVSADPAIATADKSLEQKRFALQACATSKDPCAAEAKLEFTAHKAGAAKLSGDLTFCVCSAESCLIEKVSLETMVKVE